MNRPANAEAPLHFHLVIPSVIAANQKQALRAVAVEVAKLIGIKDRILAERLLESEKESPSAMGDGVALSHLRISGLTQPLNVFVRFKTPVPYAAADKKDVEFMCLLVTPERDGAAYLRMMARASRLLRNKQMRVDLKGARDEHSIRAILEQSSMELMAA